MQAGRAAFSIHGSCRTHLGCALARLGFVALLALTCGACGEQVDYRIRISEPWPDDYAIARPRVQDLDAVLSPPIVQWHASLDPHQLFDEVLARSSGRRNVYVTARRALAKRTGGGEGPARIWVVEARIGRRYVTRSTPRPVDLSFDGTLREAIARFSEHLRTPITVGRQVNADVSVRIRASRSDLRQELAMLLARNDLFIREWVFLPVTLRSYEYPDRESFLQAAASVADAIDALPTASRLTVIPFSEWQQRCTAAQATLLSKLAEQSKARRRLGRFVAAKALPTPTPLATDREIAQRQAAFAVAAQVAIARKAAHDERWRTP
ncbi:MAG: hypothetical protein L6Q92_01505 [Phycisphaerae bacterium]|nr:hypothetical protein [Phycisphaerae bacterium]